MARTVAIFLIGWVAISIPTGIVVGRLIAAASRPPRSGPMLRMERRGARSGELGHSIELIGSADHRLPVLSGGVMPVAAWHIRTSGKGRPPVCAR